LPRQPNSSTEEILGIAIQLIAQNDISGMTVDKVAEKSGVSKATIYRRWRSRDALIFDAITYMHRPVADPDTGSLREDLTILIKELVAFLNRPDGGKVFASFLNASVRNPNLSKLQQQISKGARAGYEKAIGLAIRRGELPENVNVRLMIDIIISPFLFRIIENTVARQSDIQPVIDVALAAFGSPKERGRGSS
jgi:AcrR family transcriptional regulator